MKTANPWPRVFVEGVVIVVSILMAFGIQAWWDDRQERAREQELLMALERDMVANRDEIDRVLGSHEIEAASVQTFRESTPEELEALDPDSAMVLLKAIWAGATFTPFDGALRTGDLALIRSARLRESLGAWSGRSADVLEDAPLLFGGLQDISRAMGTEGLAILLGPDAGGSTVVDSPALEAHPDAPRVLGSLRRNDEFLAIRLAHALFVAVDKRKVGDLEAVTDDVLEQIRAQLR